MAGDFFFFYVSLKCKHVLNAQVSMRAPCCKSWYDCRQCHDEAQAHELRKEWELVFGCKKCKHVFRKDMRTFEEETDGFCPKCDNQFFIEAKTPQGGYVVQLQGLVLIALGAEGETVLHSSKGDLVF